MNSCLNSYRKLRFPFRITLRLLFCTPVLNDYFETVLGFKCLAEWWVQMKNAYLLRIVCLSVCVWLSTELSEYHQITFFKCYCCTEVNVILSERYCFLIREGNGLLGRQDPKFSYISRLQKGFYGK